MGSAGTPTTTPEDALKAARSYVSKNRGSYCHVVGLLEDDLDYFVQTELNDPADHWPLGPAAILISKATGKLYDEAWGNVIGRFDSMTPVPDPAREGSCTEEKR